MYLNRTLVEYRWYTKQSQRGIIKMSICAIARFYRYIVDGEFCYDGLDW